MALTKVRGGGVDNPLTLGGGAASDRSIIFDGNAQDFHIGLDDSEDKLTIGLGSTLGTTSHMVIDANGHITKPLQPGWFATANDNTVLTSGSYTQPLLKNELWDNNSDYDAASSGTHRFTAPVAGKYFVCGGIGIASNGVVTSRLICSIWKNDYLHQYIGANYNASAQPYGTQGSTILDLAANDYVRMLIYVDGGNRNTDFRTDAQYLATFFGGYLLG